MLGNLDSSRKKCASVTLLVQKIGINNKKELLTYFLYFSKMKTKLRKYLFSYSESVSEESDELSDSGGDT